jgi:hypothetical protein
MSNTKSAITQKQQQGIAAKSPVKTPAAGKNTPDAPTQEAGFTRPKRKLSPVTAAGKMPTGLPAIELDAYTEVSGDPVRRAASRIVSVDNANMAATDNSVDVDGKRFEARENTRGRQDNRVYSNASLDAYVDTPDEGLGGFDSRRGGVVPRVAVWPGWRAVYCGTVTVSHGDGTREEHVISFEPPKPQ